MKVPVLKIVSCAAVAAALSGCVSNGNTHALITPVGVVGYHTFKPSQGTREIQLPQDRDPNQIAAAKAEQEQAADSDT